MTKKEIDALLSEVESLADEAERQAKKKIHSVPWADIGRPIGRKRTGTETVPTV